MKKGFIALELVLLITILAGIAAAVKLAGEVQNLQKYAMMDAGGGGGGSNLIGGGSGNTSSGGSIGGGVKDPWPGSNSPAPTSKPQQSGDCFCDSAGYWTGPGCGSKLRKSCSATPRPTSQAPTPIWNCSSQGCVTIPPPFGIGSAGGVIPCKIGQQVYEKCVAKKIFVKTQEECDEAKATMSNCSNPIEPTGIPSNSDTGSPSWIAGIIGSGLEIINSLIPSWNFIGGDSCPQKGPNGECLTWNPKCRCVNNFLTHVNGSICESAGDPCGIPPTPKPAGGAVFAPIQNPQQQDSGGCLDVGGAHISVGDCCSGSGATCRKHGGQICAFGFCIGSPATYSCNGKQCIVNIGVVTSTPAPTIYITGPPNYQLTPGVTPALTPAIVNGIEGFANDLGWCPNVKDVTTNMVQPNQFDTTTNYCQLTEINGTKYKKCGTWTYDQYNNVYSPPTTDCTDLTAINPVVQLPSPTTDPIVTQHPVPTIAHSSIKSGCLDTPNWVPGAKCPNSETNSGNFWNFDNPDCKLLLCNPQFMCCN